MAIWDVWTWHLRRIIRYRHVNIAYIDQNKHTHIWSDGVDDGLRDDSCDSDAVSKM